MDPRYTRFEEAAIEIGIEIENATLGETQYGTGILAKDPSKPSRIFVPENLLLGFDDVDFKTNTVKADVETTDEIRAFWNLYLETVFSDEALSNRKAIEKAIKKEKLHEWQEEEQHSLLSRFLNISKDDVDLRMTLSGARVLRRQGKSVHMPYLDLANHSSTANRFDIQPAGVGIKQMAEEGEINVTYGSHDAIKLLNTYGFVAPTGLAYAIPATVTLAGDLKVILASNLRQGVRHPRFGLVPSVEKKGNAVEVSYLMLGDKARPELPRMVWHQAILAAKGLNKKEQKVMGNFFAHAQRLTWSALWKIRRRGEQVKDEQLRTLLLEASSDAFRSAC